VRRWAELAPTLQQMPEKITDDETAGVFAENIKMANAVLAEIADLHRAEKTPYWDHGKTWDYWKNDFVAQIDAVMEPLRATLKAYGERKEAASLFDEPRPVRGVYGSTASIKHFWTYEVVDITKVPMDYMMVDDDAVKRTMRVKDKSGRPRVEIPGIRWVQKTQLAVS
jgi:hypothetical protein